MLRGIPGSSGMARQLPTPTCISRSFCEAPPSTNMTGSRSVPESACIASSTSRVWKQMASSMARTMCACTGGQVAQAAGR